MVIVNLGDVTEEPVQWLWPGRLAHGKLTLLVGDPGAGKSCATVDWIARLSVGRPWPDGAPTTAMDSLLLADEDGLADTVKPRLCAAGGDPRRIHVVEAIRDKGSERSFNLTKDLAALEHARQRTGARVVILDPLNNYIGDVDSFKDPQVRQVLTPLAKWAGQHHVAVIAILHLTKDQQRRALYRTLGSIGFVATARITLALGVHPDDEERHVPPPMPGGACRPSRGPGAGLPGADSELFPLGDDHDDLMRGLGQPVTTPRKATSAVPAYLRERPARQASDELGEADELTWKVPVW